MTFDAGVTAGPPEDRWAPGQLPVPAAVFHGDAFDLRVRIVEVYPTGVLIELTARCAAPLDRAGQTELQEEFSAYHHDDDHRGPRLTYRTTGDDAPLEAHPWAPAGSSQIWRPRFWVPLGPALQTPLRAEVSWAARGAKLRFGWSAAEMTAAAAGIAAVWVSEGPHGDAHSYSVVT